VVRHKHHQTSLDANGRFATIGHSTTIQFCELSPSLGALGLPNEVTTLIDTDALPPFRDRQTICILPSHPPNFARG
jgi:hypothetical protein